MNRFLKKIIAASSLLAVMSIAGCSEKVKNPEPAKQKDELLEELNGLSMETDESIINELKVVNADGIYGNVYLPSAVDGKQITWWSSDKDIINPKYNGDIAPGEVIDQIKM